METEVALTIALALVGGVVAAILAHHLRLPGIVLLLALGVVLGPDVVGWVQPALLGSALPLLVNLAVAIILFEGGLNLDIRRLRREGRAIRQLVTLGALVTAVGGTLAAKLLLGWSWTVSILFGTLVIVTGPTVVTPLLRRLRVQKTVATILEAEGVLIDPIGAIVAVVTLQILIGPTPGHAAAELGGLLQRLGLGLGAGLLMGWLLSVILGAHRLVPEGRSNIFTLGFVLLIFTGCDRLVSESGILAVTIAGIVVGNHRSHVSRDLKEFKEQLTVLLIGMLFVLLAAQVQLQTVMDLGVRGLLVVAVLMFIVRPLNVAVGTRGVPLDSRQRAFLSWIAPRGIVAAAVATLFAETLAQRGFPHAEALQALVFLTIAVTVTLQGLTGGLIARLLGLRRQRDTVAILGASGFGRAFARALQTAGRKVVVADNNPIHCQKAQEEGLRVICGNIHGERALLQLGLDDADMAVALTSNSELNLIFLHDAHDLFKVPQLYAAVSSLDHGIRESFKKIAGRMLFGRELDVARWEVLIRRQLAAELVTELPKKVSVEAAGEWKMPETLLPLIHLCARRIAPIEAASRPTKGDQILWLYDRSREDEIFAWIQESGWVITGRSWKEVLTEAADDTAGEKPEGRLARG